MGNSKNAGLFAVAAAFAMMVLGCAVPEDGSAPAAAEALSSYASWPQDTVLGEYAGARYYSAEYRNVDGPRQYESRLRFFSAQGAPLGRIERRTEPVSRTTRVFEAGVGPIATVTHAGGGTSVEFEPSYSLSGRETIGCIVACLNCNNGGTPGMCLICAACLGTLDPEGDCDPDTDPDGCECDPNHYGLDCDDGLLHDFETL